MTQPIAIQRTADAAGVVGSARRARAQWIGVIGLALSISALAQPAGSAIQVVADTACPYYAENIASFATCEGDKVVRPEAASSEAVGRLAAVAATASPQSVTPGGRPSSTMRRSKGASAGLAGR